MIHTRDQQRPHDREPTETSVAQALGNALLVARVAVGENHDIRLERYESLGDALSVVAADVSGDEFQHAFIDIRGGRCR